MSELVSRPWSAKMLPGSEVITRVAFAMARRDDPWVSGGGGSSLNDVAGKVDVGAVGISEVSRVVVRWGAASVGSANVVCKGEERVAGATIAGWGGVLDWMDAVSDVVLAGTLVLESSTTEGLLFAGAEFRETPSGLKTLLADLWRVPRRLGTSLAGGSRVGGGWSWPDSLVSPLGVLRDLGLPHHVPIQSLIDGRC
jgi:hypothetical protein